MKKLVTFIVLALLLTFWATPVYAAAPPALPHAFYGSVTINDALAPNGTKVEAKVANGTVIPTQNPVRTAGNSYGINSPKLLVQGDGLSGAITFYVNDVKVEGTTATFEAGGGPTMVDLSVTIPPTIGYNPSISSFAATVEGANPPSRTLSISNTGINPTAMGWSVTDNAAWLSLSPTSGNWTTGVNNVTVSVNISGMSAGSYSATITIEAPGATNTPQTVAVSLAIATALPPSPAAPPAPPPGTTDVRGVVTTAGRFTSPVTATSEDKLCTLTIPEGTVGLTKELEPIDEITVVIMDEPPPPPEDAHVIGLTYDFGPDGATFDPPITLTFSYDPDALPEGVAEEDLVLAYYDEGAGAWVELECVVDTENNTITASVPHFTTFAIIGTVPVAPPEEEEVVPPEEEEVVPPEEEEVAPPEPAAFSVSRLSIQPAEVEAGTAVTIAVTVANTSGTEGSYTVVLKVNGVKEAEKTVTIAAGDSQSVSFSLTKEEAGRYSVTVDGLSSSFTVVVPPGVNWPVIGGLIAGLIIMVGLCVFFLIRRRAY